MKKYSYHLTTLDNGLKVLTLPTNSFESVYVSLLGKVGRRAELENETGVAHFFEHLFFDGTQRFPTAQQLSSYLESYGGNFNGTTSADTVEYYVQIIPKHLEIAFDYLSDIFFNSNLSEIDKEKKVIYQEYLRVKDRPEDVLFRERISSLYPNQTIGRTIFDDILLIDKINQKVLLEYQKRCYLAQNFILTIVGNVTKEKINQLSRQYFSQFPCSQTKINFDRPVINPSQSLKITNIPAQQAKLSISFRAYPVDSREWVYLQLLSAIIGNGQSSRIYTRIRHHKHLAYNVGSHLSAFCDTGYFSITTFVDEEKVQETVNDIFSEIKQLQQNGLVDRELEKAQNRALSGLLFTLENIDSYCRVFARQILFDKKLQNIETYKKIIQTATKENLMSIASYIFSDRPKINIVSPGLKKLKINF